MIENGVTVTVDVTLKFTMDPEDPAINIFQTVIDDDKKTDFLLTVLDSALASLNLGHTHLYLERVK